MKNWQAVIKEWVVSTLGKQSFDSTEERTRRFAEEAAELCQSLGMSHDEFQKVTKDAFNRPLGEPEQEVGGVFVTFLALCENKGFVALDLLIREHNRINTPEGRKKVQASYTRKKKEGLAK